MTAAGSPSRTVTVCYRTALREPGLAHRRAGPGRCSSPTRRTPDGHRAPAAAHRIAASLGVSTSSSISANSICGRNAVEVCHSLDQLIREELPSCLFRVPHVDVLARWFFSSSVKTLLRSPPTFRTLLSIGRNRAHPLLVRGCRNRRHEHGNHRISFVGADAVRSLRSSPTAAIASSSSRAHGITLKVEQPRRCTGQDSATCSASRTASAPRRLERHLIEALHLGGDQLAGRVTRRREPHQTLRACSNWPGSSRRRRLAGEWIAHRGVRRGETRCRASRRPGFAARLIAGIGSSSPR